MSGALADITESGRTVQVGDAMGRLLTVKKPSVVDKLRLFRLVGPDLAKNEPYLGMALVACAVTEIDGVPVPSPGNTQQIDHLVARLGDAGIAAATLAIGHEPTDAEVREDSGN